MEMLACVSMAVAAAAAVAKAVAVLSVGGSSVAVAAAVVVVMPEIMASSIAAARGEGAGKPQKGTASVRSCRGCGVMAGVASTPPAVMGVLASHTTMVPLGRLSAMCSPAAMCWLLVALLLPGAGDSLIAVPMRSRGRQGLCCLSACALGKGV